MRILLFITSGAMFLSAAACTREGFGPRDASTISRDTFVEAYYQLRVQGLMSPQGEIAPGARDRILNELGLTEEDLLTFVEVWGEDGEVMQGIWQAVDSLMREARRGEDEDSSSEEGDQPMGRRSGPPAGGQP